VGEAESDADDDLAGDVQESDADEDTAPAAAETDEAIDEQDLEDEGEPTIAPVDEFGEEPSIVPEDADEEFAESDDDPEPSLVEDVAAETGTDPQDVTATGASIAEQVAAATAAQSVVAAQRRTGAAAATELQRQIETRRREELRRDEETRQRERTRTEPARARARQRGRAAVIVPGFGLPNGDRLPEGVFPHKATWLQGTMRVIYDFSTDTETWERSPVSGEPDKTFRVTSVTNQLPRDNNFQMGLFNVSLTSSGISFSHPGAKRDAMKPKTSMPKPPRPRNPFGRSRM
jgi:hypothetical protein